jgi:hypothetical protein
VAAMTIEAITQTTIATCMKIQKRGTAPLWRSRPRAVSR